MGRGGGGGSSHSSSHHSRSHSHSGGSSRSSGSSYRSSGSSSYSHHSSRSSSYRSGSSGSGYSGGGGGYSGRSGGYSGRSGGCLGGCSAYMIIPILVFAGMLYAFLEDTDIGTFFDVQRSTIQREALPASKCDPINEWYKDDWGDWIDESGEETSLENGLKHFYETTGVQPYLWIMGEEGGDYMSEGSVEELSEATYKEMFGDDEGHVLIIFREYPNASSNYICTVTPGYDAETQVIDDEAKEIILDFIDYYYTDSELNEGQFFARAFTSSADRIMIKQIPLSVLYTIIVSVIVLVIGLIIVVSIIRKRKVAVAKQKAAQAKAEADKKKAEANKKKIEFDQQKYNDQLETQFVAVSCPNCGSTGNRIRKATVGYCQYCGTAMRVDQEGNVKIISGDSQEST
ncbi:MAG: hypothetical protein K5779_03220 [Saccharofermentans sp.]|nr:hypothetical protein [Saccharofermentans sp.]